MKRKIPALLLAVCMICALLPAAPPAQAATGNVFHVSYDMNGGCVFWSKGATTPSASESCFLADGIETEAVNPGLTVRFLLDNTRAIDWDSWKQGVFATQDPEGVFAGEDREINARVSYNTENGWFEATAVHAGVAAEGFSYENGILSFKATEAQGEVWLDVWWTAADYAFADYGWDEDEKMVELNFSGPGSVQWDETKVLRSLVQTDRFRAKLIVSEQTESLDFTWTGHLRTLGVLNLNGDGEWAAVSDPAFTSYTLPLDRINEYDEPERHYFINFDFADNWNYGLRVCYDCCGGAVFRSVGGGVPAGDETDFLYDGEWCSFEDGGAPGAVRLLLDPSRGVDRGPYEENGTVRFIESNTDPNEALLFVWASYRKANGEWFNDTVVEYGEAVTDDFSLENNVLSFTPANGYDVQLSVWWTESEYSFGAYDWTEGRKLVELNWWGESGTLSWDESLVLDSVVQPDNGRAKLQVDEDLESFEISWTGHMRRIDADGFGENGDWGSVLYPSGSSFVLDLTQTEPDGNPKRHYNVNFDFADDWNFQLQVNYDTYGGSVFRSVGEALPVGDETDLFYDNTRISFEDDGAPGTVHLLFDPTRGVDRGPYEENGTVRFIDSNTDPGEASLYVWADYPRANGEWFSGLVVDGGAAAAEGFSLANGVLSFTPETGCEMRLSVWWTESEYSFGAYDWTEGRKLVELNWWGESGTLSWDESLVLDSVVQPDNGRAKLQVDEDLESFEISWTGHVRRISADGLGENGDWGELLEPEGSSFVLDLTRTESDGNPRRHYNVSFDFADDWNGLLGVNYDANGGLVFLGVGAELPAADAAHFLPQQGSGNDDWPDEVSFVDENGGLLPVRLLLDETKALDWEAWDGGNFVMKEPWESDDRAITISARFSQLSGEWFEGALVEYGAVTEAGVELGVSYEGGLFCFTPPSGYGVDLDVFWTREDYAFSQFRGTEEAPVVVEIDWWGDGVPVLTDEIPEDDRMDGDSRMRVRVSSETESLTFTWENQYYLYGINVEGLGPDGQWLNDIRPEGNSYVLQLDQEWENGEKRDWYHIQFSFESGGPQNETVSAFYDQGKGSVFWALGEALPTADPEHYLGSGFEHAFSFRTEDGLQTVRLFFDGTRSAIWDENGVSGFGDAWELADRALSVFAESGGFNGLVVENGVLTELGQTLGCSLENDILSFEPPANERILLHVYWCRADLEFDSLQPTEEKPVIVEYSWWNYGEIIPPEGIPEEDICIQEGRTRMRVPIDTESLTFTWAEEYDVRCIDVEGAGADGDWLHIDMDQSEPHSYTLVLDLEENGEPRIWYNLSFEFFPNSDYQLWIEWAGSEGNVFFGLDEAPPTDEAHYVTDAPSFRVDNEGGTPGIGTVYLKLDPTHSVYYFSESVEFCELPEHEYDPFIYVEYPHEDGSWFEGMVVEHGQAVIEGFRFEDDTLSFTPENKKPVIVHIYWNQGDLDYQNFEGTEEKPIVVELWRGNGCPLELPDDVPAEDIHTWQGAEHIFTKVRLPASRESLLLSWPHEGDVGLLELEQENGERIQYSPPHGTSFELVFDPWEEGGRTRYGVTVWGYYIPDNPFVDVPEDAWYRSIVLICWDAGITTGTSQTRFSPNASVTRAQMVTFLWRAVGSPEPESRECPFTDVTAADYCYEAVLWAVENGITTGTSSTSFSPKKNCTRAQAVTFLYRTRRYFGESAGWEGDCPFNDVQSDAYYYEPMMWAYCSGVTRGTSETEFSPGASCTRAMALALLFRALTY